MPIDSSIYGNMQAPDIMGSIQSGLKMRDMMDERKLKQAAQEKQAKIDGVYKSAVVTNPDGSKSYDQTKLSALAEIDPKAYRGEQKEQMEMTSAQLKSQMEGLGFQAQILGASVDQPSYTRNRQKAIEMGIPGADKTPEQYDKTFVDGALRQTMTGYQQAQQKFQETQAAEAKKQADRQFAAGRQDKKDAFAERMADRGVVQQHQEKMQGNQFAQQEKMAGISAQNQERQAMLKAVAEKSGKGAENYVPGLGTAMNADDAKKLKDAKEMKHKFDRQIGELMDLRGGKLNPETGKREGGYGVEYFNREAVGRGKQLSKDLLLTYKNLAKLGVLSKSDEEIVNAIIPADPLGQDWMPGQDSIMHQLERFKYDLDDDYNTTLATRLKSPEGAGKGKEADVEQYAQSHGLTYEQALNVKRQRTGGQMVLK